MARLKSNPNTKVVALDGGKLGSIVGSAVSCIVMAFSFYVRDVDAFTAFTRSGWAFVIAYGATFFLVRVILRTTLRQMLEERKQALDDLRAKRRDSRGEVQTTEEPATEPEPEA